MATRALTYVKGSDGQALISLFEFADGYPSWYGNGLAEALLTIEQAKDEAELAEKLQEAVFEHMPDDPIYIVETDWPDYDCHSYTYDVYLSDGTIKMRAFRGEEEIFNGTPVEFLSKKDLDKRADEVATIVAAIPLAERPTSFLWNGWRVYLP